MRTRRLPIGLVRMFGLNTAVLLLVTAALLSPFALGSLLGGAHVDWVLLSDIGQTYGAVSAVLAAGALAVLAGSLLLQAREIRHEREQAALVAHQDVMRMAIEDSGLRSCFPEPPGVAPDEWPKIMYLNLVVSMWQMRWEFGDLPGEHLRFLARNDLFQTELGRKFWSISGQRRAPNGRRGRVFVRILDEEYAAAVTRSATPPPVAGEPLGVRFGRGARRGAGRGAVMGLALLGGGVAGWWVGRWDGGWSSHRRRLDREAQ